MKYLIALMALMFSSCATGEYFKGCVDGVEGMRFQFNNPLLAEPDMAQYYCKVVERNREKKDTPTHK